MSDARSHTILIRIVISIGILVVTAVVRAVFASVVDEEGPKGWGLDDDALVEWGW